MDIKPSVFAVEDEYQIMIPSPEPTLMWIQIGNESFYDESNGILRSYTIVHRISVPSDLLNKAKAYSVCYRTIPERKEKFSQPSEIIQVDFNFMPVPETGNVRAYHIADAHNRVTEPILAANAFGEFDFLIFNGDMPNHCDKMENLLGIFEIGFELTGGRKPIVFARGNHDLRGIYAEKYAEVTPNYNGKSYYTFRLGSIWGLVLDCGEDKPDDHVEYGFTICCHAFRERQTRFLRELAKSGVYNEDGIQRKIVVVHNPFTYVHIPPFDIEQDLYREWTSLLRDYIKPDLMICGHQHELAVYRKGCPKDHLGQPCDVLVGSLPKENYFAGVGIEFLPDGFNAVFTDSDGKTLMKEKI